MMLVRKRRLAAVAATTAWFGDDSYQQGHAKLRRVG
jgi:hypothetical protein